MDEPTSSLEPREVETLFRVIGDLRRKNIAVVYVSHRMDELYRVCERVTVLRDGRHIHTGELAGLDRVQLVPAGETVGGEHGRARDVVPLLAEARHAVPAHLGDLPAEHHGHQLDGVSLELHPGEVLGLGGLLGSGRSETARALAGALPLDAGEMTVGGAPVGRLTPASAIRAGISLLPEDRKADGIV
ncbi:ATP-binding cassette domain-containing protein, partial [Streptomyces sp. t39]|uniref:ATP-binding cassette domain-containing protein n=1 Tax=Streptomyces sp. t39 TaxID=1828156 RepID=UPI0039677D1D